MAAEAPDQQVHAVLSGVTRVYPGTATNQPVHALGPLDLELRRQFQKLEAQRPRGIPGKPSELRQESIGSGNASFPSLEVVDLAQ